MSETPAAPSPIECLRSRRGWSLGHLAELSGVPWSILKDFEEENRDISQLQLGDAIRICSALGVAVEELVQEARPDAKLSDASTLHGLLIEVAPKRLTVQSLRDCLKWSDGRLEAASLSLASKLARDGLEIGSPHRGGYRIRSSRNSRAHRSMQQWIRALPTDEPDQDLLAHQWLLQIINSGYGASVAAVPSPIADRLLAEGAIEPLEGHFWPSKRTIDILGLRIPVADVFNSPA